MISNGVVTIFEDKQKKLNLSTQQFNDINEMKTIVGEGNIILQHDGNLLVRGYIGFVQVNQTRLLVYPKISNRLDDEMEKKRSLHIFIRMLAFTGFDSVKKTLDSLMMDKYQGDILEIFIGLFVDELALQFSRDMNRGYNNILENQSFIKGKVDFPETVKRNSFRRHIHTVRYDQFTENILINRIFKSVIINLSKVTKINKNKIGLKKLMLWLEDVDQINLDDQIWDRVVFNRNSKNYEPSYNLAKMFYYNSSPNLNQGADLVFSFLVPANQLFEMYLYKTLLPGFTKDQVVNYQGPMKYLARNSTENIFRLRPDITITRDHKVEHLIDAKYKDISCDYGKLKISQSDIYQMLAYSVRYQCNNVMLVYPKFLDDDNEQILVDQLMISNYEKNIVIKIIKIDLEIDPYLLLQRLKLEICESDNL